MKLSTRIGVCILFIGVALPHAAADGDIETGVPRDLAEERAGRISDLEYRLIFIIEGGFRIQGGVEISFSLDGAEDPLAIDFAGFSVGEVKSSGIGVPFIWENEHIVLAPEFLYAGRNRIDISFVSDERPLHREKHYLYSLFVPALARYVFPCFDQPDLKARYQLTLGIPDSWIAVSNTPVMEDVIGQGTRRVRFEQTKPLSTYLFSFAAGEFSVDTAERDGREMILYHMEIDSAKVARNLDVIFDLHAEALRWMEEYTGMPYPFGKFDFLALPAFPYSGMEHPGAILYRAERLFLEESATEHDRLRRAGVISHETAHMWFGDLVTMEWFDDVWLKEAFAQFMADRIIRPAFPGVDHQLLFISSHHDPLHDIERSAGTHPIRQELDNLNEAGSVYGDIIYHKPPVMLNQLEKLMGEEQLREALREYLKEYSFGNATWEELVAILDQHSDQDLLSWSNAWVMEAGRPTISMHREDTEGFVLKQSDPIGRGLIWTQEFSVVSFAPDTVIEIDVRLDSSLVSIKRLPWHELMLPDSRGEGFGFFDLHSYFMMPTNLTLPRIDPVQRAVYARVLRDNFLDGSYIHSWNYSGILNSMLHDEEIELNLLALITYTKEWFWLFLTKGSWGRIYGDWPRNRYPELILLDKIGRSKSASAKSACFEGFRSIVMTDEGIETLREVWEGKRSYEGLTFSERDYCKMALELAVREVKGWKKILDRQTERIEDPELKKRFAFVRQAVDADEEKRDLFFESLTDKENRRREPWVLEALYYLYHPLRTSSSVRYIPKSLELLEEIRDTGDIFFPRDWIKATLRYHGSEEAVVAVDSFLAARPYYPVKLRRITLQAVDIPRRAVRLRGR